MYSITDFLGTMGRKCHRLPFSTLLCILIILVLALAAPVSAAVYTINPGDSIETRINSSADGDTIILNPGIYTQHDIRVFRNITIRANTSYGHSAEDTIIEGTYAMIFNNSRGYSLAVDNLTLWNENTTGFWGAIFSGYSTTTITSSTFSNCSAVRGGAIVSQSSNITVISSTFSNCSAVNDGGAIYNGDGTATITSSTFSNCSAVHGGAIYNDGSGTVTVHFSRIFNNTGTAVYAGGGAVYAENNWWGSNANPSGSTLGKVTVSPWLVLNITATPSSVSTAMNSIIRTNLTKNSDGTDTTSGGIFVPDGIPVAFAITSGTGSVLPQDGTITSGANTTTFTPAGAGLTSISATVDNQTVSADIIVTDGPGTKSMVGVYRPAIHTFILKNGTQKTIVPWGLSTDIPVAGDWNGDGLGDVGVYRPSIHMFILKNGTEKTIVSWGLGTDTPVAGDWNADGMSDVGVYRSSVASFILKNGTERTVVPWGFGSEIPVAGDWNGDGLGDVGVFRPSIAKFILKNGTERTMVAWGLGTDTPVTGDWNGDGLGDVGVFRPSVATFILKNGTEKTVIPWGLATDIPVTGKWS